ncbi:MAG: tRNA (N6-isopentenyl adenosine(37)-C2)-methylthiotransferase MiaB [Acidobacteriota bacterium]|jgi:tRNA-2-methylthio-N6-dimethylallyladenosine synthase
MSTSPNPAGVASTCEAPTAPTHDHDIRGRYYIRTYGCQMNVHDSEIYAGQMRRLGMLPAETPDEADVILVNTCSVREKAEDKMFSELGRLRALKNPTRREGRPSVRIGVTGCIAQQRGEEIVEREASVDFVLGTRAIRALPSVLDALDQGQGTQVITEDFIDFDAADAERVDRVKAFVTIMEGCNNYCSFCIVPSTRGLEVYRSAADIVDEVRGLSLRGYREVTLLGQNVNSWVDAGAGMDFPGLLRRLDEALADTPGVERIRFLTSHPKDLSPALIEAMAECGRIAKHLHLPVQSGSDRILTQMNRHYSAARYLELVGHLRDAIPDVGLSTDLIVGFPGETDEDFQSTLELVRAAQYDSFYSFEYSPRPDTAALMYEDTVEAEIKRQRLIELQELQRGIQARRNATFTGRTVEVLVDGFSKMSAQHVSGRTGSNHVVNFAGEAALIGSLVDVAITRPAAHSLFGERASTPR